METKKSETPEIIATNKGGGDFKPVDAGTYQARCYSMIVIGTVPGEFEGKPTLSEKVWISWELPTERKEFKPGEGEQPYSLHKEYTLSLHENAKLRGHLKAWRGKDFTEDEAKRFNIAKLVGVSCTLSVGHKTKGDKTYAEITAIGPPMKGMPEYKQFNPSFILTYQNWNWDAFNSLPEWLRKKMETSLEYKLLTDSLMADDRKRAELESGKPIENDDLPF